MVAEAEAVHVTVMVGLAVNDGVWVNDSVAVSVHDGVSESVTLPVGV
jgi:hypothetical protein